MAETGQPILPTVNEVNRYLPTAYPAAAASGLSCEEIGDGTATARWRFDESTLRPGRYISGPTIFGVADVALWFGVFSVVGIESMAVTSELSIRFLRPAQDGNLLARATIQSTSSRRIVGTVEVWVETTPDKLVAVAQGTYVRPSSG